MMDQLALYRVSPENLEWILERDLLVDREFGEHLERKGTFVNDLFLDGKAIGGLLRKMGPIMGAPVDALVARTDLSLEPSGPVMFTANIPQDTHALIIKTLARARRLLSSPDQDPDRASRLQQLAADFGGVSQMADALSKVQRLLEKAKGGRGELVTVFTCWSR